MTQKELKLAVSKIVGSRYIVEVNEYKESSFSVVDVVKMNIRLKDDASKVVNIYNKSKCIDKIREKMDKMGNSPMSLFLLNIKPTFQTIEETRIELFKMVLNEVKESEFDDVFEEVINI